MAGWPERELLVLPTLPGTSHGHLEKSQWLGIHTLPDEIRAAIGARGIRNSHLLAIAPTGSISLLSDNISSGIEPIFARRYRRAVTDESETARHFDLVPYSVRKWRELRGNAGLPPAFATASDLPIRAHLDILAVLQRHDENSTSKKINVPVDTPFEAFQTIYEDAFNRGWKGCTAYRPHAARGAVVTRLESNAPR